MKEAKPTDKRHLFDLVANPGEMLKASELIEIEIVAGTPLTLYARRVYNKLLHHAHGPNLAIPGYEFEIPTADLKFSHRPVDRLDAAVVSMMRTLIRVNHDNHSRERVALLGWTDLDSADRKRGMLRYSFHPRLVAMLQDSRVFASLQLDVLHAVSSKYALALYEMMAKRARLKFVYSETFPLDRLRALLGVEDGKLETYSNFLKIALLPAVNEVNLLADFSVSFEPVKEGRKVVGVTLFWNMKDVDGKRAAWRALRGTTDDEEPTLFVDGE